MSDTLDVARAGRRATALPPDERRQMIVQAALPLLIEHGQMVRTKQIADAAGIAEGTIFRVFPDKDALLDAVLDAAVDPEPLEDALGAIDPGLPFHAKVVAATEIVQQRVLETWKVISAVGARAKERPRPLPEPSAALTKLFAQHRDELTVKPVDAARLLRSFTLSTSHPLLIDQPLSAKRTAELFLHGAGVGSC